ncbi:sterol esterase precursor [Colletotrichum tofieldiae]|nr:sterol esterase precursor [Colletotrichum tofieldiae]
MQLPALLSSFSLLGAALAVPDDFQPLEDRAASTATVVLDTATVVAPIEAPVRLTENIGTFDATGPAAACPQMISSSDSENILFDLLGDIANLPFVQKATGQTEDCLSITVARPQGTKADAKLPVLYWIFGGGFQLGWSSMYDGTSLVQHGVDISKPFVFVAVNYRVAGFGFMPAKKSSRMAPPTSAFSISEWVLNGSVQWQQQIQGKALFRGAIMNSGSITPTDPVDCPKGQAVYDKVVSRAGCSGKADTLNCLREVDYTTFLNAVTSVPGILSYSSIALSYLPRPDGKTLTASPDVLAKNGQYAAVPMIIGDQEDEGTLFGVFQPNLTTTDKLVSYLKDYYFATATEAQIRAYVATYDDGLNAVINGSPHRTGLLNEIFPGFKRRSAVLGDLVFTLTRRVFLNLATAVNPSVPSWSYLASYNYGTPILGTFHGSDLLQVFYGVKDNYAARSIRTYYTNFLYALDPNVGSNGQYPNWPKWSQGQNLIQFFADKASTLKDDFRKTSSDWILNNAGSLYF